MKENLKGILPERDEDQVWTGRKYRAAHYRGRVCHTTQEHRVKSQGSSKAQDTGSRSYRTSVGWLSALLLYSEECNVIVHLLIRYHVQSLTINK